MEALSISDYYRILATGVFSVNDLEVLYLIMKYLGLDFLRNNKYLWHVLSLRIDSTDHCELILHFVDQDKKYQKENICTLNQLGYIKLIQKLSTSGFDNVIY